MGKIVGKKKKGRPSLLDLQKRSLKEQEQQQQQQQQQQRNRNQQNSKRNVSAPQVTPNYDSATATPLRRSTRRNPNHSLEDNDEEDDEEEGEEELSRKKRREKKLKLVLKLPSSQEKSPVDSESRGSDSNLKESNAGSSHKKRKIDSIGDGSGIADSKMVAKFEEEKSVSGANPTSNSQGGQLDSGSSTALPDKKLLLFILDRLQKKDTYGVFSEPVDPKELPDYHEVIEHPMDFGTIRKKLASGAYANLEQFEKDVFLISSNAMQYNAPDTIYFRQARSIQEVAKKNFENLRQDSNDNEAEPKVIRRGRPPTKGYKLLGRPSLERAASEFSSDATLATGAENTIWSNHDTRKGPLTSDKSSFADSSGKFYNNDVYSGRFTDNKSDRSEEGSILKGYTMKQGKRHFVLDENRRNTYKLFHPSGAAHETSVLATFVGEKKQLVAVGVYLEHGYTRSLARFAANLGPVAWKTASKKIERCLPAGVQFGPGWVGENDVPSQRPLLLLPSLSLPPGQQTSSQPCSVHQVPCSSSASYSLETREDKHFDKPEAANLSEKHVPPVHPISGGHLSKPIPASVTSSLSLLATTRSPEPQDEKREASEGSSRTGFNITNSSAGAVRPRPPFQIHQSHVIHPGVNGYNGAYGSNLPAQTAKIIGAGRSSGFCFQSSQMLDAVSKTATNFVHPATANSDSGDPRFSENTCTNNPSCPLPNSGSETVAAPRSGLHTQPSRLGLSPHQKPDSKFSSLQKADSRLSPQQKPGSVPPDLNIRFHSPGSPSSSQVDSAQPDLALQL